MVDKTKDELGKVKRAVKKAEVERLRQEIVKIPSHRKVAPPAGEGGS